MRSDWKNKIKSCLLEFQSTLVRGHHDPLTVLDNLAESFMGFSEMIVDEAISRHLNIDHRQNAVANGVVEAQSVFALPPTLLNAHTQIAKLEVELIDTKKKYEEELGRLHQQVEDWRNSSNSYKYKIRETSQALEEIAKRIDEIR